MPLFRILLFFVSCYHFVHNDIFSVSHSWLFGIDFIWIRRCACLSWPSLPFRRAEMNFDSSMEGKRICDNGCEHGIRLASSIIQWKPFTKTFWNSMHTVLTALPEHLAKGNCTMLRKSISSTAQKALPVSFLCAPEFITELRKQLPLVGAGAKTYRSRGLFCWCCAIQLVLLSNLVLRSHAAARTLLIQDATASPNTTLLPLVALHGQPDSCIPCFWLYFSFLPRR